MKKRQKLGFRITLGFAGLAFVLVVIINILVAYFSISSTETTLKGVLSQTAQGFSNNITEYIEVRNTQTLAVSADLVIRSDTSTKEEKIEALTSYKERLDVKNVGYIDLDGQAISYQGDADLSSRAYFQSALKGEVTVSDPVTSKQDGTSIMVAARPIYDGNGNVKAVVYISDNTSKMNTFINELDVGDTGSGVVFNKEGTILSHKDFDFVVNKSNYITMAEEDSNYKDVAKVVQEMISGENGVTSYEKDNDKFSCAYSKIENTDRWTMAIFAPEKEFMGEAYSGIFKMLILSVFILIVVVIVSMYISRLLSKPIVAITERMKKLEQGDLSSPMPDYNLTSEIGVLYNSCQATINMLNTYISNISDSMGKIASGDMTVKVNQDYVGDFAPIKTSINEIGAELNRTLSKINVACNEVNTNADQVAGGAQQLAQGATEQASAIEELSSTIMDVSSQVNDNTNNVNIASDYVIQAGEGVTNSNNYMEQMLDAMNEIDNSSQEISKIIKVINDIAYQTNILALNAAVEAARAGAAGKGFAVVAEEVRNLASKSADAANQTTKLIKGSAESVEKGKGIANITAQALEEVKTKAMQAVNTIEKIRDASQHQNEAIAQITQGIEQVSVVVQTNSATSQESAAASEELSEQAATLKNEITQFKLNK